MGKLEESDAAGQIGEPNYGYVGNVGSFQATKTDGMAMFVVHEHPDVTKFGLGSTKLEYVGPKHIGDVDGWVFKTQWDGKDIPRRSSLPPTRFISAAEPMPTSLPTIATAPAGPGSCMRCVAWTWSRNSAAVQSSSIVSGDDSTNGAKNPMPMQAFARTTAGACFYCQD